MVVSREGSAGDLPHNKTVQLYEQRNRLGLFK